MALVMETILFLGRLFRTWYEIRSILEALLERSFFRTVVSAEGLSKAAVNGRDVLRIGVDVLWSKIRS